MIQIYYKGYRLKCLAFKSRLKILHGLGFLKRLGRLAQSLMHLYN